MKKKRDTRVAASRPDYPTSTNVSSPVQAASRRRAKQNEKPATSLDLHKFDYEDPLDNDFMMEDEEDDAVVETEEDDFEEAFEPLRVKGKLRNITKRALGPPITIDEKIERLSEIHQNVVEGFLITAKQYSQEVGTHYDSENFSCVLRNISFLCPEASDLTHSLILSSAKWLSIFLKVGILEVLRELDTNGTR